MIITYIEVDVAASMIEGMCDWVANVHGVQEASTHRAFHFGDQPDQTGVCPYFVVAEVLRGHPDPRRS